ncbi:hypothetical protein KUCAC02_008291 [Scomber scombrus]|uniref:Uncharacterized protein n=1 Tax=Scomber scombrus TaxID=13677 RepID=A0AAV1PW51_SCOSC
MGIIRSDVEGNTRKLVSQDAVLETMQLKLADMEDRSRRCNVRIIGLAEGLEGTNAIQFLTQSLPKWFPSLGNLPVDIMRAHRIYGDNKRREDTRTLIFNSSHTVKQQQAFGQAMNAARAKGVEFFLLYPAMLKLKGAGKTETFLSPENAEVFITSLPAAQAPLQAGIDELEPSPGCSNGSVD